jgi:predicted ATPase
VDERQVAEILGRLVDESLVVAERDADGYRYRLLEPMRQYAREALVEAGEATALEARHHAFYLELARAADPSAPRPGRPRPAGSRPITTICARRSGGRWGTNPSRR